MVAVDGGAPDPVDPFIGCSNFSLFPLSFNHSAFSSTPDAPNPNFDLQSRLKAVVLRSPDKLLKQAHTILDESMQQDKASFPVSDDEIKKVSSKNVKNPQEKRPALGLKRAKFSAKPMPSQPDVVPEPTIDIVKLNDPVEFFAAYERIENAKKELQRLRGEPLTDLDQNLPSARHQRPSLFGKSATYKHHSYSSVLCDNSETILSSQEKSEKEIQSPILQAPAESDTVNNYEHARLSDSTPAVTTELNELDELLSCDYGGLDEAGVVDLLQDKLQIRLRDIGKPTFPDLLDVRRRESETLCDSLPKITDAITRLNGVRKAAGSKRLSLSSHLTGSSVHPQVSPLQSRSPLASISLLNRHISKLSPSMDPFSAFDIDSLPVRTPSPETSHVKQPNQLDSRDDLYEPQPFEHVKDIAEVANPSTLSEERITTQSVEHQEQPDGVGQLFQDGARKGLQDHGEGLVAKDVSSTAEPKRRMDKAIESVQGCAATDMGDLRRSPVHEELIVADVGDASLISAAVGIDLTRENKEQGDETIQVDTARDATQPEPNIELTATETSCSKAVEQCRLDKTLTTKDIVIEEPNKEAAESSKRKLEKGKKSKEVFPGNASKGTVETGGKANLQPDVPVSVSETNGNRKRKAEVVPRLSKQEQLRCRRNSLYEAGTKWEAGLRRSTRVRMRPLEYWRGERFLYGRVHDSLVTVIGVKYSSPSKEADGPPIKVKSFVSDEYKELVDLAALH